MASNSSNVSEPVYLNLASGADEHSVTEIETVCMKCFEKGTTRLLLTVIEHFREVVVSSFSCPHCHHSNSGIMNAKTMQDKGRKYTLRASCVDDLSRMVVRSEHATITIPEVELEVPSQPGQGEITTIEGVISRACEGLTMDQETRKLEHPALCHQIEQFVDRLQRLKEVNENFTFEVDDPSGNSYIEQRTLNGFMDKKLSFRDYNRSKEQNIQLGLCVADEESVSEKQQQVTEEGKEEKEDEKEEEAGSSNIERSNNAKIVSKESEALDIFGEIMRFNTICDQCHRPASTNMKVTNIPHFKEVIIMATICDHCGNRSREIKSGSGIEEKGCRISLKLTDDNRDMARDVVKSDTCSIEIPELDLHVGAGILGAKYTTIEGLLTDIKDDLSKNPFFSGDSIEKEKKERLEELFQDIDKVLASKLSVTLVLDDPTGNSFLGGRDGDQPDDAVLAERYERTFEQNDDLGLNDMKTEKY